MWDNTDVNTDYLHHYCDSCGEVINGEVFVNFVAGWKYHYHYECYKLEIEAIKKGMPQ